MYSSAINHLFCAVDIGNEVFIPQPFSNNQINFSTEKLFERVAEIEVVGYIVPFLMVGRIEVHKQIHIALVVESICQDRAKDSQSLDLVLPAKVDDPL